MILDAGPLIALDRGDRQAAARLRSLITLNRPVHTSHAVAAQVWRNPARQVLLRAALANATVHSLTESEQIGRLLAATGTSDVTDAHVAVLAHRFDIPVWTSDPEDLTLLGAVVVT